MKFYREIDFQETEIGKIPKEWKVTKLGNIITIKNGKRPLLSKDGLIPVYGANGIMGYTKEFLVDNDYTIVIGRVGASGEVHLAQGKIWISDNALYSEKVDKTKLCLPFLYYLLKTKKLDSLASKTTHPIITQTILSKLTIQLPPLAEQQKIAEILSTADRAIEDVDKTINRLERLKKALMGELLAGRIRVKEVDGKLTFYRETEFQETEIGKIPRDWKTAKLGEIAKIIMGQSPPSETYNKDGVGMPFLQGKMEFGRIYPSPSMYTTKPIKIAEPNDILISVRAPVGDVNITPYRLCIGRGLAAIRLNPALAFNLFYFYYLQWSKNRLENLGKGSTFRAITLEDLKEFKVTCPPYNEQQKLAEILSTVDKTIELYQYERSKLEKVKNGLMSVLLTGKVRARDD